jgi:phytoene dehydrogenase-like protein
VLRALHLEDHGVRWADAPFSLAHPSPGGCVVVDPADPEHTAASIDAYAPGDGRVWERLYRRWQRAGPAFLDALLAPFPPVRAAGRAARKVGVRDLLGFARMSLWSLDRVAREFDGEGGRLLLGGNMAHTDLSCSAPTGALYGWLLASLAQSVGFPVVEGGASRLTDALVDRLAAAGGEVRCDARVHRIEVRDGRATRVMIEGGEVVPASRAVLADTSAPSLYGELLPAAHVGRRQRHIERRFRWDHATLKVDWVLDAPIPWDAEPARRAGVVHVIDSLDELRTATRQLEQGVLPRRPFMILGQTSTADPTRAPAGTEVVWAYTHVPQSVQGDAGGDDIRGQWDTGEGERMADRIEAEIERRAPGFRAAVRARHVLTPVDLEALDANLRGGAVGGGTSALGQQLFLRPNLSLHGGATTPVRNLYLASASAHPGGGVHGACGANAAHLALRRSRRAGH